MKTKQLSKFLLIVYLVILIWILLFKFSMSINDVVEQMNSLRRNINLVPFGQSVIVNGNVELKEIIYNVLIFLPFGGLLGIVDKKYSFLIKIWIMGAFSLEIEILQYLFAMGATDITDLLMNTFGGFVGLAIYILLKRVISERKLDSFLTFIGLFFLTVFFIFLLVLLFIN